MIYVIYHCSLCWRLVVGRVLTGLHKWRESELSLPNRRHRCIMGEDCITLTTAHVQNSQRGSGRNRIIQTLRSSSWKTASLIMSSKVKHTTGPIADFHGKTLFREDIQDIKYGSFSMHLFYHNKTKQYKIDNCA